MRRGPVIITLMSSFALSACGVKGDLQTAPPMWGDKAKQDQAQQQPAEPKND